MQSPERVREIGRCKWCGCALYGKFYINSLEEMFWEKGYDCEHYDPDYSDKVCPNCGEPSPVLHCENCGYNWEETE